MPEREVIIENFNASEADGVFMARHAGHFGTEEHFFEVQAIDPELGYSLFTCKRTGSGTNYVSVALERESLRLDCDCKSPGKKLCIHQAQVLGNLLNRRELRIFFDAKLRHVELQKVAKEYGLEEEKHLDDFFTLEYQYKSVEIKPRAKELFKIGPQARASLKEALLPQKSNIPEQAIPSATLRKQVLVFRKHKYYSHFYAELYEAESTLKGKIKNPLVLLNPMDLIWKTEDKDELRFYSAVSRFRQSYEEVTDSDLEALKALVKNPGALEVFELEQRAKSVTVNALEKVQLKALHIDVRLKVDQRGNFYEVTGELYLDDRAYHLEKLQLKYKYFLDYNKTLYLIDNPDFLKMIDFFKKHNNKILIHQSGFDAFQENILSRLEDRVHISYAFLKPATPKQLLENNFDVPREKIIYLSDEGEFVLITPVMKYGNVEVPVLSKKNIYAIDSRGNPFTVSRDQEGELRLTSVLIRQHPHFEEQLEMSNHFYLHKSRFLDNGWFLEAFEDWQKEGIQVLGFNELKNNKLNPNKAKIDIKVLSGLDWFETAVSLSYGQQQVSLKYLHKSIRNKSKFVQLGDGTLGILPEEWMEKFSAYFKTGELAGECIRTPRSNFGTIEELYEEEILSKEVRLELSMYKNRLRDFESITEVSIPKGLQGELRTYQRQGLNWLNFLDEFGFGGCLADDMGLGKTIQIIAFMVLQKEKAEKLPASLLVLPTTLIFNWQAELRKFAPGLKVLTVHGTERVKDIESFKQYDVIITSYGTLLYDIRFMKKYLFNYVFFDESQTIKNPSSQRYQAAALLRARNRIVITGTPVENNTFDLYGQLSLASPGLLGSRQFFKEHYFVPIDQFKDSKRALELQKKIRPFILRRTKKQVASELPDKTEMVIYCEMGEEQRKVYDSYKKEYRNFLLHQKEEDLSRQGMHVLKGMTLLRQICNSVALLKEDVFYGEASSKISVLMEEIEGKAAQHKILVFSQFVGMLDLIRKELDQNGLRYEYLTGQTRDRAAKVEAFQNKEEVRIFLISLKAGGTGLNLTEADYVYLVDPWWNPAVENQAIDRSYRIGQKKNVIAVRLICPDTIEEKIMRLQESKKDLVSDLIKTDSAMLKHFSKEELLDLFN